MSRLDNYRTAMLAAHTEVSVAALNRELDERGPAFATFVVDFGLGPLWHARTRRDEFHASRVSAEARYLAQIHALEVVNAVLDGAGIEYAVIKGAANRIMLYETPAIRACQDLDLLVRPADRVQAVAALVDHGFVASAKAKNIGHELVLTKDRMDVDLHWGLFREGRLRADPTAAMLDRRQRVGDVWILNDEDAFFLLLVHPAFTKHLAGWEMGLHRVVDIIESVRKRTCDWQTVSAVLEFNGVQTAAWATLRWVQLVSGPHLQVELDAMMSELCPGALRRAWLDRWLKKDLSERMSNAHWLRLLGFSMFLHDAPGDSARALAARLRAHRRVAVDLAAFKGLLAK
jgi:hypothetical protein